LLRIYPGSRDPLGEGDVHCVTSRPA
jgi:hypothetical protein